MVTITEVRKGNRDGEQTVEIVTQEFGTGRPYRPGKSMLRVLIAAWGKEASTYTGRRLMLYRDPDIRFGKDAVGGIRISALSDIEARMTIMLTVTRGRRAPFTVDVLPDAPASITPDKADAIRTRITAAATLADLKTVADELKTLNLGAHRDALMAAWSERKGQVSE